MTCLNLFGNEHLSTNTNNEDVGMQDCDPLWGSDSQQNCLGLPDFTPNLEHTCEVSAHLLAMQDQHERVVSELRAQISHIQG